MTSATYDRDINIQYGRDGLIDRILAALQAAGRNTAALTRDDLSTFDEFHIGGIAETRALAGRLNHLKPGTRVLDVGSGLGGPARTLAAEFGCQVVGLDITEEYCQAATVLTRLVGLSDRVTFQHGNALDLPFEDGTFDVVWSQFAGMNIPDKPRFYAECRRVLGSGGHLAFHEVMDGTASGLHYPVFWADDESINHLRPPDEIRRILKSTGFDEMVWVDLTRYSSDWFRKMLVARTDDSPPPLGFSVFVGESTPQKAKNLIRNLEEDRIAVVQAVYRA